MENNLRTQILLPSSLREEVERARRVTGESLGEYVREALRSRLEKRKRRKADLTLLAQKIGTVKKSGWEGADASKWQRSIREDRRI